MSFEGKMLPLAPAGLGAILLFGAIAYLQPSFADPPGWCLVFEEEFLGDELNTTTWLQEAGEPQTIHAGGRWPVSNTVRNGKLYMTTKRFKSPKHIPRPKEAVFVPTRRWSTGHIWTKNFTSKHGFYEARLKIGNASGLNNAFWLIDEIQPLDKPFKKPVYGPRGNFEIDILEAHHKDERGDGSSVHFVLHARSHKGKGWGQASQVFIKNDLSNFFHTYAVWWRMDNIIVFYIDGKEYWRGNATEVYQGQSLQVHLSTAIHWWAGKFDWGNLEGTEMVVDYVRVWEACEVEKGR